jgi:Circularly permutated YpsA SLOG family
MIEFTVWSRITHGQRNNCARGPRIRSGGQTGVDRAALDAAVLMGRTYEGWCPKGGWAEDFLRPPGLLTIYPHLMETPSESPEQRTEWNVRDSAATVVFVPNSKYCSAGTDFTIECAKKHGKPYCILHYLDRGAIIGLRNMISQLGGAQSLNFAGPRESEHLGAYDLCLAIFIEALASHCGKNSDPKPTN